MITLFGGSAVLVSKLSELAAALFLNDPEGGLPVQTLPRNGIFYEGRVRAANPEGSQVLLDPVTEYRPCIHSGHGLDVKDIESGKTVGVDTLSLTIALPTRERR